MSADTAIGTHRASVSAAITLYFPSPARLPGVAYGLCTPASYVLGPSPSKADPPIFWLYSPAGPERPISPTDSQNQGQAMQSFSSSRQKNNQSSDVAGPRVIDSTHTSYGPRRQPTSNASIRSACPSTLKTALLASARSVSHLSPSLRLWRSTQGRKFGLCNSPRSINFCG